MQIGIIGTGTVGTVLTEGLVAAGHDVSLGSRDPGAVRVDFGADADSVAVGTQREAAAFGAVVVLALPGGVVVDVATDLADVLAGKPVVDATNEYPSATDDRTLAARIAAVAPDADVVKAFNTIGANRMTAPVIDGKPATMFLAGDDPTARETVATLATDLGFDPVSVGDLDAAGHLEHLARFWIYLSTVHGRDIGFRLLRE